MLMAMPLLVSTPVNAEPVNCEPWTVLKQALSTSASRRRELQVRPVETSHYREVASGTGRSDKWLIYFVQYPGLHGSKLAIALCEPHQHLPLRTHWQRGGILEQCISQFCALFDTQIFRTYLFAGHDSSPDWLFGMPVSDKPKRIARLAVRSLEEN
jgi:hypothetical protein